MPDHGHSASRPHWWNLVPWALVLASAAALIRYGALGSRVDTLEAAQKETATAVKEVATKEDVRALNNRMDEVMKLLVTLNRSSR